ncbi:ABC transporter ATP-binding protein [Phytoactinopolyspora halotolerans]|uniref:ABC transporter ATP-binding protein n=1 Tax=Phytoactinopolyspora halotolerans TaxID=1981512 RepID=A0A6L9S626_9ACTN|nr:ABC transporter ATP-binding protein [Phytoactinopolyspora halotolerans]NEE00201.1 ABC transporter ATP-binding protein [Phytoactinopolyspora halotolerans]
MTPLMEADDLAVDYQAPGRRVRALDGVDLTVARGETVGIVGESGSGKSTLGSAIGRLLSQNAQLSHGALTIDGESLFDLSAVQMRRVRREKLGFVFQDPIGSLDPTKRVGAQLRLALRGRGASLDVTGQLERVRLADPRRIARAYPHQLSGGMAQRVAIAMAMATEPELLVADEPTAALDSQVRDDVSTMIFALAAEAGTSILWLSHDLAAVGRRCGRVAVMYGGRVVEDGPASEVLARPAHPYTHALANSAPASAAPGERLQPVPGRPPVLTGPSPGCAFADRCGFAIERCRSERPRPVRIKAQSVLCHRAEELAGSAALAVHGVGSAVATTPPVPLGGDRS